MEDMISRKALCEYALNQKDKSITPNDIMRFPSAQPETHDKRTKTHACDCIERQAAISAVNTALFPKVNTAKDAEKALRALPSAQADSKETSSTHKALDTISRKAAIEIASGFCHHANIAKELAKLPSAQPDLDEVYAHAETEAEARYHAQIVRCKDCKHQVKEWRTDKRLKDKGYMACGCEVVGDACGYWALLGQDDDFCSKAERRTDG